MGAEEALQMYDVLVSHNAVTPELTRRYVMQALVGGLYIVEGSQEFEGLMRSMDRDIRRYLDKVERGEELPYNERRIGWATGSYVGEMLAKATNKSNTYSMFPGGEVPETVVYETMSLFGKAGSRYLGLRYTPLGITMDSRLVNARLFDDYAAREEQSMQREQAEAEQRDRGPRNPFDEPLWTFPEEMPVYWNPFDIPFPNLREYESDYPMVA